MSHTSPPALEAANSKSVKTAPSPARAYDFSYTFRSADEILEFVTKNWQSNWVTTYLPNESVLEQFARRPFFLLVSVDAPLMLRWQRYQQKCASVPRKATLNAADSGESLKNGLVLSSHDRPIAADRLPYFGENVEKMAGKTNERSLDIYEDWNARSLEEFVLLSDKHLYDPASGKRALISRATVRLVNSSSSIAQLEDTLAQVNLLDEDRLRPSWDTYFMALASLAAHRSNCMKRRVGCVIVRDKRVISTGYNGTPRGLTNCAEGGCPRCNQGQGSGHGLATCLCLHAEENALLEAGRDRVHVGAVLYCDTCPCLTCSIKIVQVGIREVVYSQEYSMDGETASIFTRAGVSLRKFVPPANGLIHLDQAGC